MSSVKIRDNESFDGALRRFRRSCEKAGILAEARKRTAYEKPTTVRKRKAAAAKKRYAKKLFKEANRFKRGVRSAHPTIRSGKGLKQDR